MNEHGNEIFLRLNKINVMVVFIQKYKSNYYNKNKIKNSKAHLKSVSYADNDYNDYYNVYLQIITS